MNSFCDQSVMELPLLWKPDHHYHGNRSPSSVPVPIQQNPVCVFTLSLWFILILSSCQRMCLTYGLFPLRFLDQNVVCIYLLLKLFPALVIVMPNTVLRHVDCSANCACFRHYRYEQKLACLLWKIDMRDVTIIPTETAEATNKSMVSASMFIE